jgi:hypothetical protein
MELENALEYFSIAKACCSSIDWLRDEVLRES